VPHYEYKVVPAPTRGEKVRGIKGTQARFAHALADLMNQLGRDGWEYQRADTLPCEERQGLTRKATKFVNLLVFRRIVAANDSAANDSVANVTQAMPAPEIAVEKSVAASVVLLRADAPEGTTPMILQPAPGPAPAIGPAADPATAPGNGTAAE